MYAKVFRSIFDGSLYGHFEATIVFLAMLVLADKDGSVDMTAEKLAAACGYPIDIVEKGLAELQQPDPRSRTPDEDGRRITLLHEAGWGWQIVNYAKYRDIRSTEDRREYFRIKKQEQRAASKNVHNVHQSPPASTARHPSESDADSESEATKTQSTLSRAKALAEARAVGGLNVKQFDRWVEYRAKRKPAIKTESLVACAKELAKFEAEQEAVVDNSIANGYQGLFAPKRTNGKQMFHSLPPELRDNANG